MTERKTKRQQVIEALLVDDLRQALKVARCFRRDFTPDQQKVITRAAEFDTSTVYRELGYDRDCLMTEAEKLLREKYISVRQR
jgi:hypothetical protein